MQTLPLQSDLSEISFSEAPSKPLRSWYESSPAMLHVLDLDGTILLVSNLWLSNLGYSSFEVLGRPISDFLTPQGSILSETEIIPRFLERGMIEDIEFEMVRRDGTILDVLISATLEQGDAQTPARILALVTDVSGQRQTERELARERERLLNILEGTHAATWEWNLQTHTLHFNERWAQIVGWSPGELVPTFEWLREQMHPEDRDRYREKLEAHCKGETDRCEADLRIRHRDGRWIWVADCGTVRSWTPDGKPEWMFGTRLDISERMEQEEALRKSQDFLKRTGALAGIGGWQVDLVHGVVEWSPETYRIHQVPEDYQPTLEKGLSFYAPEAKPVITEAVARASQEGTGWDLELPFIRYDGVPIIVRVVGTVTLEEGRPVRISGAFQDVTHMRRLANELAEQHELLRVTLQSIGDAVITADASGLVTWLNPVAERVTGWSNEEAQGVPSIEIFKIVNETTRERCASPIAACLLEDRIVELQANTVLLCRDGSECGIEDSASPIRSRAGEVLGAVLIFRDVSEQRRLASEISHRASHDQLTGLWNRTEFEARLCQVIERTRYAGMESALLFLDLDQFKVVNDSCGHGVGDELLIEVSQLLTETVRANDVVARLGGDEFGIILELCPFPQAGSISQKICDRLDDFRFTHGEKRFRVGASVGLVHLGPECGSTATIMQAADSSCYAAKEAGRNRIHIWKESDSAMAVRRGETRWASRLEDALDEGSFVLYAQRYQSLQEDNDRILAEVLLRMVGKDGSLIPPGAFLPAAERFHLASRIDRFVFEKVIAYLESSSNLHRLACLNVNLSGQSISDEVFHRWAIDKLSRCPLELRQVLCVEITETVAVTNLVEAGQFIREIRDLGVRVALDDFGSGASWFGYLSKMPVDYLKIDGQFIRDLLTNPLSEATVRCFADIATTLKLQTVAEWVETSDVENRLREMGVSFAQGFGLFRPAPIEELWAAPRA